MIISLILSHDNMMKSEELETKISHAHSPILLMIKGIQDLKIYSHANSQILSLPGTDRAARVQREADSQRDRQTVRETERGRQSERQKDEEEVL